MSLPQIAVEASCPSLVCVADLFISDYYKTDSSFFYTIQAPLNLAKAEQSKLYIQRPDQDDFAQHPSDSAAINLKI